MLKERSYYKTVGGYLMKKLIVYSLLLIHMLGSKSIKAATLEEIFTEIYEKHGWGGYPETYSGTGSTLKQTIKVRELLSSLISNLDISTILDAPCGDFNWMKKLDLSDIQYTGVDIVKSLITQNNAQFSTPNIAFNFADASADTLPQVDLILCRDLFLHLYFKDIKSVINNFKRSGSKYLLASTYAQAQENVDRETVNTSFRPINLELAPFNLPKPIVLIKEDVNIKYLGLWNLDDIPYFVN